MAVRLRLKKMGRRHRSFYRVSAIDSRSPRDGRAIEELGWYDPENKDPQQQLRVKLDRLQYWLSVGAIPSPTVADMMKRQGQVPKPRVRRKAKPTVAAAPAEASAAAPAAPAETPAAAAAPAEPPTAPAAQ